MKRRLRSCTRSHHHRRRATVLDVQQRGEYVYAALGQGGFRVYDIANIDNKDFSERIVTAPVSPLGQRLYVKTKYAPRSRRRRRSASIRCATRSPENEEQADPPDVRLPLRHRLARKGWSSSATDRRAAHAGVGRCSTATRRTTSSSARRPSTRTACSTGARRITIAGHLRLHPDADAAGRRRRSTIRSEPKVTARARRAATWTIRAASRIQFRYAFVVDKQGLKVLDVTALDRPRPIDGAQCAVQGRAQRLRRRAPTRYVAAGHDGLGIVDIERRRQPALEQMFNAGGTDQRHQRREDRHDERQPVRATWPTATTACRSSSCSRRTTTRTISASARSRRRR